MNGCGVVSFLTDQALLPVSCLQEAHLWTAFFDYGILASNTLPCIMFDNTHLFLCYSSQHSLGMKTRVSAVLASRRDICFCAFASHV